MKQDTKPKQAKPLPSRPRARKDNALAAHVEVSAPIPVALTVAGSDSGGGAGIQADLKTFEALGVFGTVALTCATAQNPDAVDAVEPLSPDMVARQIRTVCDGFPVAAAKTGMLYSAEIIEAVAELARERLVPNWVVDPVMIATSGARLLREDAIAALCRALLPHATVLTPNAQEAEVLWERSIRTEKDLRDAARAIGQRFGVACVVKGGHLAAQAGPNPVVADALWDGADLHVFTSPAVSARETHGTGCTFSAALAAGLALGRALPEATRLAQRFVAHALRNAVPVGRHAPLRWA